jgi:7,8-dihydro-6-hydroxymethylpterin-pyrophosphokinase
MSVAYVALGSNLGNRKENIQQAMCFIKRSPCRNPGPVFMVQNKTIWCYRPAGFS